MAKIPGNPMNALTEALEDTKAMGTEVLMELKRMRRELELANDIKLLELEREASIHGFKNEGSEDLYRKAKALLETHRAEEE